MKRYIINPTILTKIRFEKVKIICLIALFSISGCHKGKKFTSDCVIDNHGAIIRTDTTQKVINLVFTGHEFADGSDMIRKTLQKHGIKAAFFFTGDFYRNPDFKNLINKLKSDGHYLGAHSDKHLLYCAWENRDSLLVTREEFVNDLETNYLEMGKFGIRQDDALHFMAPYEWYNKTISQWSSESGRILVNFSPGTFSNGDWTYPELGQGYYSTDYIYERILDYESNHGLNGFILLTHIGTDPRRTDKFYYRLDELIKELKKRGYEFNRLDNSI